MIVKRGYKVTIWLVQPLKQTKQSQEFVIVVMILLYINSIVSPVGTCYYLGIPYIKKLWKLLRFGEFSPLTFGRNKAYAQEVLVLETHSLTYCMGNKLNRGSYLY